MFKKNRRSDEIKKEIKTTRITPAVSWFLKAKEFWRKAKNHHVVPLERGGKNENSNIKKIDGYFHWLLHELFDVMTPEEKQIFLGLLLRGQKKSWNDKEIIDLRNLIMEGKMMEALNLSQFNHKSSNLAIKFQSIIEKRMKR